METRRFNRIAIVGCGGAGKSTLSRALSAKLGIECHHLDRVYWLPGWQPKDREQFIAEQRQVVERPAWIIDGNYTNTMDLRLERADTIVFLDFPTLVCLWGAFRRYLQYRRSTRPDMTAGNVERLSGEYLHYILTYRRTRRPRMLKRLQGIGATKRVVILKSRAEVQAFLG